MSLDIDAILDSVVSHAMTLGFFERVNQHEPKNAPGNGLTCAVWVQRIDPIAKASGLQKTSARVVLQMRLYTNMLTEPQDMIDPNMVKAVNALITCYSAIYTLGLEAQVLSDVRNIDLLGQTGVSLSAEAGYIEQDDGSYRVMTITIPVVVNDAWDQQPLS